MSCVKTTGPVTRTITANSNPTKVYTWYTEWYPAMAMDAASGALKVKNLANALRVQIAYQTAQVRTDKPDTPVAFGTAQTADGEVFVNEATFDLDTVTPGKTFIRFGIAADVSSTPNMGSADVTLEVAMRQCGYLLPPWSGHLVATSTDDLVVPISGWMPALGVIKIEGTIIVTGLTGLLQLQLVFRTAAASPTSPDAWDMTGLLAEPIDANTEENSGERTVNNTTKMWVQIGAKYDLSSGSTPGQADVAIALGIRSSA